MIAIVNFKAYASATGGSAVKLAKACEKVAKKEKANVVLAVQPADIGLVSSQVGIPVLAQHVDPIAPGARTGWILPESAQFAGAMGSLVNHSEHKVPFKDAKQIVSRLKSLGLISVMCAAAPNLAVKLSACRPDVIAVEPPELIGGKKSVSTAKPEVVTNTTKKITDIPVICGAGINSREDVENAVELGAQGFLVASAVTKAKNPGRVLAGLVRGLR